MREEEVSLEKDEERTALMSSSSWSWRTGMGREVTLGSSGRKCDSERWMSRCTCFLSGLGSAASAASSDSVGTLGGLKIAGGAGAASGRVEAGVEAEVGDGGSDELTVEDDAASDIVEAVH